MHLCSRQPGIFERIKYRIVFSGVGGATNAQINHCFLVVCFCSLESSLNCCDDYSKIEMHGDFKIAYASS